MYTKTFTGSVASGAKLFSVNLSSLNINVLFFVNQRSYVKFYDSESAFYSTINKPSTGGSEKWGMELSQSRPKYIQVSWGSEYINYSKEFVVTLEYTKK